MMWTKEALSCIEHARLSSTLSLAVVQATLILADLAYLREGVSSRLRLLHASGVSMALELGIHVIDADQSTRASLDQEEIIRNEFGRRVWWHMTCSDW